MLHLSPLERSQLPEEQGVLRRHGGMEVDL